MPQARKLGRKKGSTNRYKGVEKAYRNLQVALRKETGAGLPLSKSEVIDALSEILEDDAPTMSRSTVPGDLALPSPRNTPGDGVLISMESLADFPSSQGPSSEGVETWVAGTSDTVPSPGTKTFGGENVESLLRTSHRFPQSRSSIRSNPLWLIADASREALAVTRAHKKTHVSEGSERMEARNLLNASTCIAVGQGLDSHLLEEGLTIVLAEPVQRNATSDYFKFRDFNSFPDAGSDFDPIEQGLVTMWEAQSLFLSYFERVNLVICVLDPKLHTVEFVRFRSNLLFTWILAITAQFQPGISALATRLRIHGERLCKHVYTQGLKSTEIVQGYYIYLHTTSPATTYNEEHGSLYAAYAFGLASTLYLDEPCRRMKPGIDPPDSMMYELLSRNRERTWLRVLAWERANSAVCNRADNFPDNDLLRNIETWCQHPLSTSNDKYTCAFVVLWQQISIAVLQMRRGLEASNPDPRSVVRVVDNSLAFWRRSWLLLTDSASGPERISTSYTRYVYKCARLWALSTSLGTSFTAGTPAKATIEDCFQSAIECCEMTVQILEEFGEPLYLVMTPIWALACYAAVLALKLFPVLHGDRPGADAQLMGLLSQVALRLEQA